MIQIVRKTIGIGIIVLLLFSGYVYAEDLNSRLIDAAEFGDTAEVKELLAQGADVNARNENGDTALIRAADYGHTEIVKMLLSYGADANAKNDMGITALMCAAMEDYPEIVKILLSHGADVNATDMLGDTALMYAANYGYTEIVKILLSHGADANVRSKLGGTALGLAVEHGHTEIVKILIAHGAEVTPEDIEKHPEIAHSLKQAEAHPGIHLRVKGILCGRDGECTAVVKGTLGDEIVKVGDKIEGAEIIEINKDFVKFKYRGKIFLRKIEPELIRLREEEKPVLTYKSPGMRKEVSSKTGIKNKKPTSTGISSLVRLKGGHIIAASKELFDKALDMVINNDKEAFLKLMATGLVGFTKDGVEVYVIRVHPFGGTAEVRPKGETAILWTDVDAFEWEQ